MHWWSNRLTLVILLSRQSNVKKSVVQGYLWKVDNYAEGQEIIFLKNQML